MAAKSVLIVDDEEGIRSMLKTALEMYDYHADTAANGKEAVDLLAKGNNPGLILLDLMMPAMNGWAFADVIKKNPRWADIPMVVISAFSDREGAFPLARETLEKPLDFDVLLELVEKYCGKP